MYSILNNGNSTGWFQLHSGLRQGCPVSPYLFLLVIEEIAARIREDSNIEGIAMGDNAHKISLYADE